MATITLNNEQLRLVQAALELYSRIGILQFERIFDHPTIDALIDNQFTPKKKLEVGDDTMRGEIVEIGKKFIKTKGSWGNGEEIKKVIFALYKVHPVKVNILNIPKKHIISKGKKGVRGGGRKAFVYLKTGDKIEFI